MQLSILKTRTDFVQRPAEETRFWNSWRKGKNTKNIATVYLKWIYRAEAGLVWEEAWEVRDGIGETKTIFHLDLKLVFFISNNNNNDNNSHLRPADND